MKNNMNLASTDKIKKSQLDEIMKAVILSVQRKSALAKEKLDRKIKQEMQNATIRVSK